MLRRKREQQQEQDNRQPGARRVPQHEHHRVDVRLSCACSRSVLSRTVREVVKHLQFARGQVHAPCDQLEAWLTTLEQRELRSAAARRATKVRF